MGQLNTKEIWEALEQIVDPEIPVISLVELGVIREVALALDGSIVVTMTPTFSGCPAQYVMRDQIIARLRELGAPDVYVKVQLSPPWSSDWISETGREALRSFGLAPPPAHGGLIDAALLEATACPYCGSQNTEIRNLFGPTLCRSLYFCRACREPFERFKPL